MKLFKSKSGFTLIELLVVIGILAVLAAIAIPSVAGLIDRANVSADKTNANEMTNAIERFTSEYELYCQDIASGAVQAGNLDSAQGRVYNVLGGATTRAEITALEKPATAGPDTTGRAIYRDTKYPVNAETMQAIVENYTKTSSSTFEPKQSDMHFWYSPDCGVVVFGEPESTAIQLNAQIQSGKDAKGNTLGDSTKWIDLTAGTSANGSVQNPEEGTFFEYNFSKYQFEEGMTWREWIYSDYNTSGFGRAYCNCGKEMTEEVGEDKIICGTMGVCDDCNEICEDCNGDGCSSCYWHGYKYDQYEAWVWAVWTDDDEVYQNHQTDGIPEYNYVVLDDVIRADYFYMADIF